MWILEVFTKLNQLSGEDIYGFVGGIASEREQEASRIMCITDIIACSGDGICA